MQQFTLSCDRPTYSAGLGNNSPAATPTDVAFLQGIAGTIVRVTAVRVTVGATAAGFVQYQLVKRVGGTQTVADTPFVANTHGALYDSADPASLVIAQAQSGIYTANRTNGTIKGIIDNKTITLPANGTAIIEWYFGNGRPSKCPVLRDATQNLCVNGNGHTLLTGELFGVSFEWTESVE